MRVFQPYTCSQRFDLTLVPNRCCCAKRALCMCARFPFLPCVSPHCGCPCAHSVDRTTDSRARVMAQEQNSAHPFTMFHQLSGPFFISEDLFVKIVSFSPRELFHVFIPLSRCSIKRWCIRLSFVSSPCLHHVQKRMTLSECFPSPIA